MRSPSATSIPNGVAGLNLSIEIAVVVIVGGIGTLWGPILGSVVVVMLTELTNIYLGSLRSGASLVIYGLAADGRGTRPAERVDLAVQPPQGESRFQGGRVQCQPCLRLPI